MYPSGGTNLTALSMREEDDVAPHAWFFSKCSLMPSWFWMNLLTKAHPVTLGVYYSILWVLFCLNKQSWSPEIRRRWGEWRVSLSLFHLKFADTRLFQLSVPTSDEGLACPLRCSGAAQRIDCQNQNLREFRRHVFWFAFKKVGKGHGQLTVWVFANLNGTNWIPATKYMKNQVN